MSRWQLSHAELYYWSRPESRKMQKPPYTNSRDRQPADPENQFEVTSFNINHGNWPADCWGENMSPKVSAFQSKVDSFSQWRQLINYLVRIMMDYQKLSSNYYSAAAPCYNMTLIMNAVWWFGRLVACRQQGHFPCPIYIIFIHNLFCMWLWNTQITTGVRAN